MIKPILPIYQTGWFYLILLFWGAICYCVSVGDFNSINQLNIKLLDNKTNTQPTTEKSFSNNAQSLTEKNILSLYASFNEDNLTDITTLLAYHPDSLIVLQGKQSNVFIKKISQYLSKKPNNNKIIIESAYTLSTTPITISSTMFFSSVLNWFRFDQTPNKTLLTSKYFTYAPFLVNQRQSFPLLWQHKKATYLSLPGEVLRQLNQKNELTLAQHWQLTLTNNQENLAAQLLPLGFFGDVFTSEKAYDIQQSGSLNIEARENEAKISPLATSKLINISQFIKQQYGANYINSDQTNYKVIIITDNPSDERLKPLLLKLTQGNYLSQNFITLSLYWILLLSGIVLIWLIQRLPNKQQALCIITYVVVLFFLQSLLINQQQWLEVIPVILFVIGTWGLLLAYHREISLIEGNLTHSSTSPSTTTSNVNEPTLTQFKASNANSPHEPALYKSPQNFSPAATIAPTATGWGHLVKNMPATTKANNKSADLDKTLVITAPEKKQQKTRNQHIDVNSFGRYQIEGILGKGAMGIVYQGVDPKINRHVAIKTLQLSTDLDSHESTEAKERFFREAQTAGGLSHANIVTIYDVGEENDLGYIAMDLLTGAPLSVFSQPGQTLPVQLIYQLLIQITDALEYAHNQNVVHRDIKPGNIIYDDDLFKVTVTDFGIAYVSDHSKTRTGVIMGSPYYMSPEQILGLKVDGRSDIFSLGVTFYQLLTGNLPFEGESIATVAYQITKAKPTGVNQHNPELPPSAQRILNKAMHKDIEKRYQSMADFKLALVNALKRDFKTTVN
ncbi:serine/threonine-protein kinase [Colwellia echini]|uniref:Serine/threonine protein kinase n=1 Tax=Colwellia echini TaxID=1982103 RepID=A0ABY3MYS5_9GAMM|nr:serine/threonine-protein kinase [Colwellia echini]TYK66378.1 serine/threonine protein kinase [Colwellia echini]